MDAKEFIRTQQRGFVNAALIMACGIVAFALMFLGA